MQVEDQVHISQLHGNKNGTGELDSDELHCAQTEEHKKLALLFKRNNFTGIVEMVFTLGPLHMIAINNVPYEKLLGALFASLAVFFIAWDYSRSKSLDKKVAGLVMRGVELEREKSLASRFFHNVLSQFSIVKILVSRSLSTAVCVYFLCGSLSKIFMGKETYGDQRFLLALIGVVFSSVIVFLYYSSFKELDEAKS